jgi:hypothetical protein
MLKYYGYDRIKALMDIYPEIGLEATQFQSVLGN